MPGHDPVVRLAREHRPGVSRLCADHVQVPVLRADLAIERHVPPVRREHGAPLNLLEQLVRHSGNGFQVSIRCPDSDEAVVLAGHAADIGRREQELTILRPVEKLEVIGDPRSNERAGRAAVHLDRANAIPVVVVRGHRVRRGHLPPDVGDPGPVRREDGPFHPRLFLPAPFLRTQTPQIAADEIDHGEVTRIPVNLGHVTTIRRGPSGPEVRLHADPYASNFCLAVEIGFLCVRRPGKRGHRPQEERCQH